MMLNGSQRRQLDGILSVTIFLQEVMVSNSWEQKVLGQGEGKWVVV